jgi:hypothetical protein
MTKRLLGDDARYFQADAFRKAAFDVCTAVRRLNSIAAEPGFAAGRLPRPAWADLVDARAGIDVVLRHVDGQPALAAEVAGRARPWVGQEPEEERDREHN